MAADPKEFVDGAVNQKKLLDVWQSLEPAHMPLPLPSGLMGALSAVVGILIGAVVDRGKGEPRYNCEVYR